MSKTKFVTIASFLTPEPAYLARARLDAEGIAAFLENDAAVGMMGVLSNAVGGVKLQVEQADVERAVEILQLAEDDEHQTHSTEASPEPWTCSQCGEEVEGTFDVCWSCGASREGQADPTFMSDAPRSKEADHELPEAEPSYVERGSPSTPEDDSPPLPLRRDDNPYRSPQTRSPMIDATHTPQEPSDDDDDEVEDETPDELALRAFRSAIFGIFFFMCAGLLNLYSMYVLMKIGSPSQLSKGMKVRYLIAFAIDAIVAMGWGIMIFSWFLGDAIYLPRSRF